MRQYGENEEGEIYTVRYSKSDPGTEKLIEKAEKKGYKLIGEEGNYVIYGCSLAEKRARVMAAAKKRQDQRKAEIDRTRAKGITVESKDTTMTFEQFAGEGSGFGGDAGLEDDEED